MYRRMKNMTHTFNRIMLQSQFQVGARPVFSSIRGCWSSVFGCMTFFDFE